ncbi:hypothetical protein BegalDRAFT_3459 [Beggiatoa alba B18LD]|uniref:Uncharacterized protein n=1 Tax=Beggiatoa alba B18LD TaxID=395493 RepID=I3CKY0_9GAMM|nr:hypothetical protein [Beggiatoa alba]EIJ44273.1 hypothetical protein BegalDRAFT_3459 [Beggiatoa alba B18LD]
MSYHCLIIKNTSVFTLFVGYLLLGIHSLEAKPYNFVNKEHATECRTNAYDIQKQLLTLNQSSISEAERLAQHTADLAIIESQLETTLCYFEIYNYSNNQTNTKYYSVCMLHDGVKWISCLLYESINPFTSMAYK